MRKDMSKVIVERPRRGGGGQNQNKRKNKPLEDLPSFESMGRRRQYGWDAKELNENLKPLSRFLEKQVGRPWNDVHSEICENIKLDSAVQRHILQHLDHMVEKKTVILEGIIYFYCRYGSQRILPVDGDPGMLYVHPENGLLCKTPDRKRVSQAEKPKDIIRTDDPLFLYHRIDGIWYKITLQVIDRINYYDFCSSHYYFDLPDGRKKGHFTRTYYRAATKCQLSGKELKSLKLVNG